MHAGIFIYLANRNGIRGMIELIILFINFPSLSIFHFHPLYTVANLSTFAHAQMKSLSLKHTICLTNLLHSSLFLFAPHSTMTQNSNNKFPFTIIQLATLSYRASILAFLTQWSTKRRQSSMHRSAAVIIGIQS